MGDIVLTAIALLLCCMLLWLRVCEIPRTVHFRAFRGTVHAAGGIGALASDPITGSLVARVARFTLRGPGFDLGDLVAHDTALAVAAGHTVTAVYAERGAKSPQPALLFNHDSARWRSVHGAWARLRGDAASHFLPVLVIFVSIGATWLGVASSAAPAEQDARWRADLDPVIVAVAGIALALAVFAAVARLALRSLDVELERRAVQALRNALFALPETDRARRALFNLAAPRTRHAPQAQVPIAI